MKQAISGIKSAGTAPAAGDFPLAMSGLGAHVRGKADRGLPAPSRRSLAAMSNQAESPIPPKAVRKTEGGKTVLELSGDWKLGVKPEFSGEESTGWPDSFRTEGLGTFDSTLPAYLLREFRESGIEEPPLDGLRDDLRGLMELALKVPERSDAKSQDDEPHGIRWLGVRSSAAWVSLVSLLEFIGDTVLATLRFLTGRPGFRARDFWLTVQECGVGALPIVSLISFLIGLILAFVGNVQLANFGASLYVADLVGIAMVREMGVVMTAIIMSGRTGAAFAAHIGSMNANQEIDALKTFGFNPFDFLVLPRVLAMVLMMPLLTIYSNVIGILGGMLVAAFVGIPPALFWTELVTVLNTVEFLAGSHQECFLRSGHRHMRLPPGDAFGQLVRRCRPGDHQGGGRLHHHDHRVGFRLRRRLHAAGYLTDETDPAKRQDFRPRAHHGFRILRGDAGSEFDVKEKDIFIIMGGSGCGKSTLLRHHDRPAAAAARGDLLWR